MAEQYGIQHDDWVTIESRRGSCTLKAQVVRTIRPDTVFIPYHWAGRKKCKPVNDFCSGSDFKNTGIQSLRSSHTES